MTNVAIPIHANGLEETIGRKVRNLMLDHGLKATDLARLTGMEATGLSRRLAGKRGWEPDDLAVISYVFNVSVAYLFGEIDRVAPLPAEKRHALAARFPWAEELPDLDSNQEPIGFKPRPSEVAVLDVKRAQKEAASRGVREVARGREGQAAS